MLGIIIAGFISGQGQVNQTRYVCVCVAEFYLEGALPIKRRRIFCNILCQVI